MLKDKIAKTAEESLEVQKQEVARGQSVKSEDEVVADAPLAEGSLNMLTEVLNKEFTTDPESLGYSGKTAEELADLLNNPYIIETEQDDIIPARLAELMQEVSESMHADHSYVVDADGKVSVGNDFPASLESAINLELEKPVYAGMTRAEGILLMRQGKVVKRKNKVSATPRWAVIIKGIPFAPNIITADELRELGF